jgi:hypothetical protein
MAQITIDDDTKVKLRKAADEYMLEVGLGTLSLNQFVQMLLGYWRSKNDL